MQTLSSPCNPPTAMIYRFRCKAAATATAVGSISVKSGSLYEVLRLKRNASSVEIKAAYRNLAKLYHPDACSSDGCDFIQIHNAYETLSDPSARALYDLSLGFGIGIGIGIGNSSYGRRSTRRWETDQCW